MPYTYGDIGGCNCPATGCNVTFCVLGCNGVGLVGAVVTVLSGMTTVASGTTIAGGCVVLDVVSAGTYTVTVTYAGYTSFSGSKTVTCGGLVNIALGVPSGFICIPCCSLLYPTTTMTGTLVVPGGFGFTSTKTLTFGAGGGGNWAAGVAFPDFYGLTFSVPTCTLNVIVSGIVCYPAVIHDALTCTPFSIHYTWGPEGGSPPCNGITAGTTFTLTQP